MIGCPNRESGFVNVMDQVAGALQRISIRGERFGLRGRFGDVPAAVEGATLHHLSSCYRRFGPPAEKDVCMLDRRGSCGTNLVP